MNDHRVTITISMPNKSAEKVKKAALKAGLSLSRYICQAAEARAGIKSLGAQQEAK